MQKISTAAMALAGNESQIYCISPLKYLTTSSDNVSQIKLIH